MKFVYIWTVLILTVRGQPPLQRYNVDRNAISVSGLSAGASMATQIHVAFSSSITGGAMFAGMPYYCAQGSLIEALNVCMSGIMGDPDMDEIYRQTDDWSSSGAIDPTSNLQNKPFFIFHGTEDPTVIPESSRFAVQFYQRYGSNIAQEFSVRAGHGMPTENNGIPCEDTDSPYINRCNYHGAFMILNHIYNGNLTRPTGSEPISGDFLDYAQGEFASGTQSFDPNGGYIYVPSACRGGATTCRLHVALHGCQQGREFEGTQFAQNADYNRVGEINNIIILYPQIISDFAVTNPNGCYDWWGYDDDFSDPEGNYATKNGPQMRAIKAMIDRVAGS